MAPEQVVKEITDWIHSDRNYEVGVTLYSLYGKNLMLKRDFPGKAHKHMDKLTYELCKIAGIDYQQLKNENKIGSESAPIPFRPMEIRGQIPVKNVATALPNAPDMPETLDVKKVMEYPSIIRRVIAEYAEAYQERSKLHRIMIEMPEGNSQTLKTKRAEIFEMVKGLSDKLERFYAIREEFEKNGFVPAEEDIWPKPKEKAVAELPNDPDELKKMKKNLQSANVKDQNMLDFQSEKKGEKARPMPAGPKRMKLESRIKARLAMIEQIEYKQMKG